MEWRAPLYHAYNDIEKAFNAIYHEAIWTLLKRKGIPRKLITLMKELYTEEIVQVTDENHFGEPITK